MKRPSTAGGEASSRNQEVFFELQIIQIQSSIELQIQH